MATVIMLDAIGANEQNIPRTTKKVAGYTTQIGRNAQIQWSAAQFAQWSKAGIVPINQDPMLPATPGVTDVENGAYSMEQAAGRAKALGVKYMGTYVTQANLSALRQAFDADGVAGTDIWLANWNLNEEAAGKLIGEVLSGFTVKAVQWASPTSNPDTLVPGSGLTLKQAGVDISVADESWFPAPVLPPPVITTPAPAVVSVLVTLETSDSGKTWKVA
jgi:hypothetical protein